MSALICRNARAPESPAHAEMGAARLVAATRAAYLEWASVTAPLVFWRSAADELAHALRRHGVDPDVVTDVRMAWIAFREFAQVEFSGLDPTPESDADGLIAQWGRYSWNDHKLSLSFTRQLAVMGDTKPMSPSGSQPTGRSSWSCCSTTRPSCCYSAADQHRTRASISNRQAAPARPP